MQFLLLAICLIPLVCIYIKYELSTEQELSLKDDIEYCHSEALYYHNMLLGYRGYEFYKWLLKTN